ncbi:hypothetical protein FISHEDRAFT_17137, partial [Fistulina hepatica ATCC 64428]
QGYYKKIQDGRLAEEVECAALAHDDVTVTAGDEILEYAMMASQEGPPTYREAVNGPEGEKWFDSAKAEIVQCDHFGTWDIVTPPKGERVLKSKFV